MIYVIQTCKTLLLFQNVLRVHMGTTPLEQAQLVQKMQDIAIIHMHVGWEEWRKKMELMIALSCFSKIIAIFKNLIRNMDLSKARLKSPWSVGFCVVVSLALFGVLNLILKAPSFGILSLILKDLWSVLENKVNARATQLTLA